MSGGVEGLRGAIPVAPSDPACGTGEGVLLPVRMGFNDREYARHAHTGRAMRSSLPPVTKALIVINVLVFVADLLTRSDQTGSAPFLDFGAFTVDQAIYHGQLWKFLTFQFLHESIGHILFNMIGVFIFAPYVETWWGKWRFLAYYLLCGAAGALFFSLLLWLGLMRSASVYTPLIGASAGVFGLLFAIYKLNPSARVMLWFPPVTLTLRTLALIFAGWSVITILGSLAVPQASIFRNAGGEAGHLGGAIMGLVLMSWPQLLRKGLPPRGPKIVTPKIVRHPSAPRPSEAEEVNRILEKIHGKGIASLTPEEREILSRAARQK